MLQSSNIEKCQKFINQANNNYHISINDRLDILKTIYLWIIKNQGNICLALKKDLSKSFSESILCEIYVVISEIRLFLKKLKKWTKSKKINSGFFYNLFFRSFTKLQPLGTCLIISSFNYPFQLTMLPLIESIAAGNYSLLKISEKTNIFYDLMISLVKQTQLEKYIHILDKTTSYQDVSEIIKLKPNLIFFTGSAKGGQSIYSQASQLGIKTILELGSACPVIVDETANLKQAAKKIAWGKSLNSGQSCVSPNTVYVVKSVADKLTKEINNFFKSFYGENVEQSQDLSKIIDEPSLNNIINKIKQETDEGLNVNLKELKIRPKIINLKKDQKIACEEIFAPILFFVIVDSFDDALFQVLKYHNNSLASYYFGKNKNRFKFLIQKIKSGSWNFNEVVLQVGNSNLPFGGIETSGIGRYHGLEGLKTFSNICSLSKAKNFDPFLIYPPFKQRTLKLIKKIFRI